VLNRFAQAARSWLVPATGLLLTACPPTDDYRIVETPATGGSTASGGDGGVGGSSGGEETGGAAPTSGAPATGGSAGSAGLAGSGVGGSAGSGVGGSSAGAAGMDDGKGGKGGETSAMCPSECNAGRTCDPTCQGGWVPTSVPPGGFSPRERAAYASLGNQLFVWGGLNESGTALNSGALYDPRTDSWRVIASDANTPSPRADATAVWTGGVVLVVGGIDPYGPTAFADGARYDPADDTWLPMAAPPTARVASIGGFGQTLAVFWGGTDEGGGLLGGLDIYDTEADTWQAAPTSNEPTPRQDAAWGDGDLTFWLSGGRLASGAPSEDVVYYSFGSERWVNVTDAPLSPRWGGFGAFIGSEYHTWGGRDVDGVLGDGARYGAGTWPELPATGAPTSRYAAYREAGWAWSSGTSTMVMLGGLDAPSSYLQDGAIYDASNDSWSAIPAWPGRHDSHAFGAAGIAAGEIVVWGGRSETELTNGGTRYLLEGAAAATP